MRFICLSNLLVNTNLPEMGKNYLVVIAGPTATGKSDLAVVIARSFNTVVLSADSRQFYKEMNAGTAKPAQWQRDQVPHYLIDTLSIEQEYTASDFEQDAINKLEKIYTDHNVAVLAGGSGLFIRAVTEGLDPLPTGNNKIRNRLYKELREKGLEALQQKLQSEDPEAYHSVDLFNPKRVMRALEVKEISGKPISEFWSEGGKKKRFFTPVKIGLDWDRKALYERINARCEQMLENGLLEEARELYPYRHLNPLHTVGYREFFEYLEGKTGFDEAIKKFKQHTRNYARRQLTWFRHDNDIHWFKPGEREEVIRFIQNNMEQVTDGGRR